MSWLDMIEELKIEDKEKFIELFKKSPCNPLIYILRVQEKVGVEAIDYYKILAKKSEEEGNKQVNFIAKECVYLLRERSFKGRTAAMKESRKDYSP